MEGFFKRLGNRIGKALITEPLSVGLLNDTTKKYTEKDLFEATEEAFKTGYVLNADYDADPKNIKNNRILNKHKEWFISIRTTQNFKK